VTALAPAPRPSAHVWRREKAAGLETICRSDVRGALLETYEQHRWVYDSLVGQPGASLFRGRYPVVAGRLGPARVVVKRMYHGGLFARLWKDAFLSSARVEAHVERAEYLRLHGVPTSPVVFASWRRVRGFTRCEIGFELIDGAIDADRYFFGRMVPPADWELRAEKIGELVARLHEIRFVHADLNLMNILLGPSGETWILDLDKTPRPAAALSERKRKGNLARLERSIRKQGRNHLQSTVETIVRTVRASYERATPAGIGIGEIPSPALERL
jgi:tRNA A-37 threonylcarbamoyl transferase component Bud32